MTTAIANARQTVAAPVRKPRRFGLLSVVDVVDGGEAHWILGGLTADGEDCSEPEEGLVLCSPSANKASRSWYSDIEADPWLAYMFETCKTVGRFSEAASKLRDRFLASEQSAVEAGFQKHVLSGAYSWGEQPSVASAIGKLEQEAGEVYGGQITLHLPFLVAEEASKNGAIQRVGDHLETIAGSYVSVGNYSPALNGGSDSVPVLYATGAVVLYRSPLIESGPVFDETSNDYFSLVERTYAGLVDCFMASATTPLCGCSGSGGGTITRSILSRGESLDLTSDPSITGCTQAADYLNTPPVWEANPLTAWGGGWTAAETLTVTAGASTCAMKWDGTKWTGLF